MKNNPDSTNLSEVVKEYTLPATHAIDGVRVPVSPVTLVDATQEPIRQYSAFNWDSIPVRIAATADPAAGAEPVQITFAGRALFMSGSNTIACDATVISRYAYIEVVRDGINVDQNFNQGTAIPASQTVITNVLAGVQNAVIIVNAVHNIGIASPGIEVPAGGRIRMRYTSIQAGDNCGVFRYSYKEAPA